MATASLSKIGREIGTAVKQASKKRGGGGEWYGPHMAAASRAIADRIPLVDIVLEIRDARVGKLYPTLSISFIQCSIKCLTEIYYLVQIPFSSQFDHLRNLPLPSKRIVVLNKMDLANPAQLKEWINYLDRQNCVSFGVNSHNKDNVKQVYSFTLFFKCQFVGLLVIGGYSAFHSF